MTKAGSNRELSYVVSLCCNILSNLCLFRRILGHFAVPAYEDDQNLLLYFENGGCLSPCLVKEEMLIHSPTTF